MSAVGRIGSFFKRLIGRRDEVAAKPVLNGYGNRRAWQTYRTKGRGAGIRELWRGIYRSFRGQRYGLSIRERIYRAKTVDAKRQLYAAALASHGGASADTCRKWARAAGLDPRRPVLVRIEPSRAGLLARLRLAAGF